MPGQARQVLFHAASERTFSAQKGKVRHWVGRTS